MKLLISLLACIFLVGCPYEISKKAKVPPVPPINLNPKVNSYAGIAIEANQRLILSTLRSRKVSSVDEKEKQVSKTSITAICAEPAPDGSSGYSDIKKLFFEANNKKVNLENNVTYNVTLPHPSHPAVKFYRDGVFALC